jgi:Tfp pilus assembly protein PilF
MRALTVAQASRAQDAMRMLASKLTFEASKIANALAVEAPNVADAQHLLALCHAAAGFRDAAESAFQAALRLIPNQPMFLDNYAKFLRKNGYFLKALDIRKALVEGSASFKNMLGLGQAALDVTNSQLAVTAFRQACKLDANSASAQRSLCMAWQQFGELNLAEVAIQRALILENSATNWSAFAYLQRISGRPEFAIESYRKALALEPHRLDVRDGLSGALIDALAVSSALRNAEALVEACPEYAPAQTTLVNLRFMYSRDDVLIAPGTDFEKAALSAPANFELQLAWIGFLLETKQSAQALDTVRRTRIRFDAPILSVFEANALEQLEQCQQAAALYSNADRYFGTHDVAFINAYVRHLLKRGDVALAEQKTALALDLDPNSQESWAYRATAWRLMQDAREYWLCDYDRLVQQMPLAMEKADGDLSTLLTDVRRYLDQIHLAQHEPAAQSVRGGSQTPGVLFGRNAEPVQILERVIRRTLENWVAKLPDDATHPFLRRKSSYLRFAGSWSVKLWKSGVHANHFHNQGWISSAFYVSLPSSVTDAEGNAGAIQFGQPPIELNLGLSPRKIIKPLTGHLALFPSYLWHGTVPFEDQQPRITAAFDVVPVPAALFDD